MADKVISKGKHGASEEDHAPHVVSGGVLLATGTTLLVLTGVTVAVAHIELGKLNLAVALGIACVKATVVALFFMHLRWDRKFHLLTFVGSLFFLLFMILFLVFDTTQYHPNIDEFEDRPPSAAAAATPLPAATGSASSALAASASSTPSATTSGAATVPDPSASASAAPEPSASTAAEPTEEPSAAPATASATASGVAPPVTAPPAPKSPPPPPAPAAAPKAPPAAAPKAPPAATAPAAPKPVDPYE